MDITIFGYKLNLEVLILIGVVYLILVGHLFGGCCNMNRIMESFDNKQKVAVKKAKANANLATQNVAGSQHSVAHKEGSVSTSGKEGFTGANINYGESSAYSLTDNTQVDTSSWSQPNLTVVPGQPLSEGVKKFLARKQQQLPLPEGEMDFFANAEFKPECCPSSFSSSTGCWCGSSQDFNYLITRGGNNVPYSEY
jgi:hypothetical protein